jgi:hypothetical protein
MGWTISSYRTALAASLAAATALAAPAGASVGDFRLPPAPSTQEPPPPRVGPVAPDVPESRVRPTPTPTASSPATPVQGAAPVVVPPRPNREASRPAGTAQPTTQPTIAPVETSEAAPTEATSGAAAVPSTGSTPIAPPPASPAVTPAADKEGGSWWPWALAGLLALGALGFAGWRWWQQRPTLRPGAVPQLERPRVARSAEPEPGTAPAPAAAAEPLQVTLEPLRLSLTLINATLSYRLEVANRGASPIEDLKIGADMISAHASMSREEQLAGPSIPPQQRILRLDPGQSEVIEGEFRVPFSQIVPIRQGNAALLLPLARFRLETAGAEPVVRTFVVGQPGQGAGLQPFRLDLGPRIYPRLAQRAFA